MTLAHRGPVGGWKLAWPSEDGFLFPAQTMGEGELTLRAMLMRWASANSGKTGMGLSLFGDKKWRSTRTSLHGRLAIQVPLGVSIFFGRVFCEDD